MNQVLIVDHNPLFRLALRELVKDVRPDLRVVEAESFSRARSILEGGGGFVLVMIDMNAHDFCGFVGLFQLRSEFPTIPVIVFSTSKDTEAASRAVAYGAAGYISKSAPCDVISRVLKSSLSGREFVAPPIIANENQINPLAALSPAQLRILDGLKAGQTNKEMAFEFGLTEKTVKSYVNILFRKLGISSRAQAHFLIEKISVQSRESGQVARRDMQSVRRQDL